MKKALALLFVMIIVSACATLKEAWNPSYHTYDPPHAIYGKCLDCHSRSFINKYGKLKKCKA